MSGAEVVFDLLVKITDCCDVLNIPYYLGFYSTRLALTHETLPAGMRTSEILVPDKYVSKLYEALQQDGMLMLESLENNPFYTDTCIKVAYSGATFFDLLNPSQTLAPSYNVLIIPIVPAPVKKDKKAFMEAHYDVIQYNMKANRMRYGYLKYFPQKQEEYHGAVVNNQVQLLRYKYRKYRISTQFFEGNNQIMFNGHMFSCVQYPEVFLSIYYKKTITSYGVSSKLNASRYILLSDIPYAIPNFKKPILIRVYAKIIKLINKYINEETKYLRKQQQYFFRTVDRFAMVDLYESQKNQCIEALSAEDWALLGPLLAPYIDMAEKYHNQKMAFAFDYDLYNCLMYYLYHTGTNQKLLLWLINEKENAFSYLEYVNTYNTESPNARPIEKLEAHL